MSMRPKVTSFFLCMNNAHRTHRHTHACLHTLKLVKMRNIKLKRQKTKKQNRTNMQIFTNFTALGHSAVLVFVVEPKQF